MPDYSNAEKSALFDPEASERFILRNRAEIRSQLISLSRTPDIITAYFNEGRQFILTAVLGVIDERGLLVLDVGPDDEVTHKAIESGQLHCTTRHAGVPIRFTCNQLQSARFQARAAIATPIPDSLYRMQRREFFRVTTPKLNGPRCVIPDSRGGLPHQLTVIDISAGGAGLLELSGRLQTELFQRFEDCRLFLPEHSEITTHLVVRNISHLTQQNGDSIPRYGVAFEGMSPNDNATLQRYIFHLQTLQPK